MVSVILALTIGAVGAVIAFWLGFPAPFLTGPALAVMIGGLAGLKLTLPALLRDACFVVIGLSMGTGVTPEVYRSALQWPYSFLGLAAVLLTIIVLGRLILMRVWRYDHGTATLSTVPGHLSYVLGISAETRSDLVAVSLIQSVRVAALTLLVPFAVLLIGDGPAVAGLAISPMTMALLAISIVAAGAIGFGLKRARVPAAFLLGGLLFSTVSHLGGWIEGAVPDWLAWPSFAILGTLIGTRFSGVSLKELRRVLAAGLAFTLLAFAVAAIGALAVSAWLDLPLALMLVAFAPGGVESMATMAVTLDVDPTFVAAHHIVRLFVLTFMAPLALALGTPRTGS